MIPAFVTLKGIYAAIVVLAFAILLILLGVQTVRIEGFKVWPISAEGYKAANIRIAHDLKTCKDGQVAAAAAQKRVNDQAQTNYNELKQKADDDEQKIKNMARTLTDSYAATHRVHAKAVGGGPAQTSPSPQGDSAGVSQTVPANPDVVISDSDLHTCADVTAYALRAHDWAVGISMVGGP